MDSLGIVLGILIIACVPIGIALLMRNANQTKNRNQGASADDNGPQTLVRPFQGYSFTDDGQPIQHSNASAEVTFLQELVRQQVATNQLLTTLKDQLVPIVVLSIVSLVGLAGWIFVLITSLV